MIQKLSNRFRFLDYLIRKRATGSPRELAQRLGITERAWHKIRDELAMISTCPSPMIQSAKRITTPKRANSCLGFSES
ncbi:hypothetical protein VF13_36780 [Nostoc linckia z16]|nr:hypothetical protein VF13_36780 [Nostoc linckia z16]